MRLLMFVFLSFFVTPHSAHAANGDPVHGAKVYERCKACHSLERNRSGPRHCGLLGRPAGSLPGYRYSTALSKSGIVWDEAALDRFLEDPMKNVPGTKMGYAGVKNPDDRADLIAYLKKASRDPALCEQPQSRRTPKLAG